MEEAADEQEAAADAAMDGPQAPMFEVDPFWPKPLPNHWILGSAIGVDVDSRGHVWVVHRGDSLGGNEIPASLDPPQAEDCCAAAPPVLEFDSEGNLVGHWEVQVMDSHGLRPTMG